MGARWAAARQEPRWLRHNTAQAPRYATHNRASVGNFANTRGVMSNARLMSSSGSLMFSSGMIALGFVVFFNRELDHNSVLPSWRHVGALAVELPRGRVEAQDFRRHCALNTTSEQPAEGTAGQGVRRVEDSDLQREFCTRADRDRQVFRRNGRVVGRARARGACSGGAAVLSALAARS
jgi:hypothetical protein